MRSLVDSWEVFADDDRVMMSVAYDYSPNYSVFWLAVGSLGVLCYCSGCRDLASLSAFLNKHFRPPPAPVLRQTEFDSTPTSRLGPFCKSARQVDLQYTQTIELHDHAEARDTLHELRPGFIHWARRPGPSSRRLQLSIRPAASSSEQQRARLQENGIQTHVEEQQHVQLREQGTQTDVEEQQQVQRQEQGAQTEDDLEDVELAAFIAKRPADEEMPDIDDEEDEGEFEFDAWLDRSTRMVGEMNRLGLNTLASSSTFDLSMGSGSLTPSSSTGSLAGDDSTGSAISDSTGSLSPSSSTDSLASDDSAASYDSDVTIRDSSTSFSSQESGCDDADAAIPASSGDDSQQ